MRILTTLILLLCLSCAHAQDYKMERDILYASDAKDSYTSERCRLDVYYPTNKENCPVVVWFHGGGLEGGGKFIPEELKNAGYVVIAANYRFLHKVSVEDCLRDAAQAVAWAFKNAEKYGGSPHKIVVSGHSAGGYLTTMLGLDKRWLKPYGVDADSIALLVPFSGQAITHFNVRKRQNIGPLQPTIDDTAPLSHLRGDCPPMVIVSGDRELELYGRYEEQAYLWRMLKLAGHPNVLLYEMQGFDHGAMAQPAFHVLKESIKRFVR